MRQMRYNKCTEASLCQMLFYDMESQPCRLFISMYLKRLYRGIIQAKNKHGFLALLVFSLVAQHVAKQNKTKNLVWCRHMKNKLSMYVAVTKTRIFYRLFHSVTLSSTASSLSCYPSQPSYGRSAFTITVYIVKYFRLFLAFSICRRLSQHAVHSMSLSYLFCVAGRRKFLGFIKNF